MIPTREEAERLLSEAEACNSGPWGNHSRVVAHCAMAIAAKCPELDPEKAYILGLLHDIGRKFGVRHLGHVSDGYTYMRSLGYDDVSRICLTHSFNNMKLSDYVGKYDTTPEETALIEEGLASAVTDEYDMLIQLCDALAGTGSVLDIEERMADVRSRYGFYPTEKWDRNLALKKYFEDKTECDIYEAVDKDSFAV